MSLENKWLNGWLDPALNKDYLLIKETNFNIIESYIKILPNSILDIGCGLAKESELFQKKYNSKLYLLDGDFEDTLNNNREINYGEVSNFKFYSKINDLKKSFDERKMQYNFVNANNINIEDAIKFDLVYSIVSCGFHYPAITYKNLILKHTTDNSVIIMDLRKISLNEQLSDIKIINVLEESKKSIKAHIKFIT
jgi:SAM-dependent methyltransferase